MWKTLIFSALLTLASCRPDSVVPHNTNGNTRPVSGEKQTVSIAYLKSLYTGAPTRISAELHISGAVISDDRHGNFYKTLVIDDGSSGIEVNLDMEQIFKHHPLHSKATIRCNALWLGSHGGTLQLGGPPSSNLPTTPLHPTLIAEHIFRDTSFLGEITPLTLSFKELAPRHISTLVAFNNTHFIPEELGLSWEGNRHLINPSGDTLIVRTSPYASFATKTLPVYTGHIEGVLSLFNNQFQLTISHHSKFTPE